MTNTICFFGSYDQDYPRNKLLKKALKNTGYNLVECNDRNRGLEHYKSLIVNFTKQKNSFQIIFVGVLGHYDVPLAWLLAKIYNKKIMFDAFYSLYDTYVLDRKVAKPNSFAGFRFYFYDWLSSKLADKIILDTVENIDFFVNKYNAKREKFFELTITADFDVFKPVKKKKQDIFTIGFYGSFMPLHGVDMIIEAMAKLRSRKIKCIILGEGPGKSEILEKTEELQLQKSITFIGKNLQYNKLPTFFDQIDVFLAGPFGSTEKASRVLPAKAAESLSCGVPTIVRKSPATSRILKNYKGRNLIWLNKNTSGELAELILKCARKNFDFDRVEAQKYFNESELSFNRFTNKLTSIINN